MPHDPANIDLKIISQDPVASVALARHKLTSARERSEELRRVIQAGEAQLIAARSFVDIQTSQLEQSKQKLRESYQAIGQLRIALKDYGVDVDLEQVGPEFSVGPDVEEVADEIVGSVETEE